MNNALTECENTLPSSLTHLGVIMQYTLLDYVRSRRFYILLTIVLGISAILSVVVAYSNLSIYFMWGAFAPILAMFSGIFFGGDAISGEFQNKTGYFSVTNPVRRSSFYVGKWLSAFVASSIMLAIFAGITLSIGLYGGSVPTEFGFSLLFVWFFLAAVLGFVFFFSSLFKSNINSVFLSAMLLLVGLTAFTNLAGLIPIEPWFILNYGAGIIGGILTVPYPAHVAAGVNLGKGIVTTTYTATVPEGLIIIGAYFIIATVLGLLLFERKEFT
jgi:ABC-type transport system involved in multi-copper enzyme maturation permease subunit